MFIARRFRYIDASAKKRAASGIARERSSFEVAQYELRGTASKRLLSRTITEEAALFSRADLKQTLPPRSRRIK